MIPEDVLARWALSGPISRIDTGRINDTYLVDQSYVVQRVNKNVFRDPAALISNYRAVYDSVFDLVAPLVPTIDGADYVLDESGHTWRAFVHFESRNFRQLPDSLCRVAGEAYGLFLDRVAHCQREIQPSIEGFHQLEYYLDQLNHAASSNASGEEFDLLEELMENRVAFDPNRQVIHGDCKVSNLLFHPTAPKAVRIVDLDTVMVGHPAWDFGDLVRSLTSGIDTDSVVGAQMLDRVKDLCIGFFSHFKVQSMVAVRVFAGSPSHMALMLGVRYLTDHISGNRYFKVDAPDDNLARARRQFEISKRLKSMQPNLEDFIAAIKPS
ncbi:MAG: aminoglycoside phosphotransferase family protein [Gammaproteobacteria bacterium]|nr:aminoglycoside phosphotransferase family protein [Gammaproteobacteria bacterium]